MKFDLHAHSTYSPDGSLSPKELVRIAQLKGLSGIAVTDHNTIKGALEARKHETESFKVIVGAEIRTTRGDLIGLFLTEEVHSRDFHKVVAEIREQDGLSIIPHPFDRFRDSAMNPTEEEAKIVDGLEVFNSRCILKRCNEDALRLAQKIGSGMTAGSDAHFEGEIGNAGVLTNSDDLKSAIIKGQVSIFGKRSFLQSYKRPLSRLKLYLRH